MIGRGPGSGLLGHVTALLSCFYVKIFLPSIFTSVDFCSGMSCIVVDIELADKNVVNEFGNFLWAKFKDTHFVLQNVPTHKASVLVQKKFAQNCVEKRKLGLQRGSTILPRAVKGEYFAIGTETGKLLGNF